MLENYVRTDLALELKEDISEKNDIAGVRVETYEDSEYGLTKTHIRVLDQTGAEILGKPIGNYITLESSKLCSEDENIGGRQRRQLQGYRTVPARRRETAAAEICPF